MKEKALTIQVIPLNMQKGGGSWSERQISAARSRSSQEPIKKHPLDVFREKYIDPLDPIRTTVSSPEEMAHGSGTSGWSPSASAHRIATAIRSKKRIPKPAISTVSGEDEKRLAVIGARAGVIPEKEIHPMDRMASNLTGVGSLVSAVSEKIPKPVKEALRAGAHIARDKAVEAWEDPGKFALEISPAGIHRKVKEGLKKIGGPAAKIDEAVARQAGRATETHLAPITEASQGEIVDRVKKIPEIFKEGYIGEKAPKAVQPTKQSQPIEEAIRSGHAGAWTAAESAKRFKKRTGSSRKREKTEKKAEETQMRMIRDF